MRIIASFDDGSKEDLIVADIMKDYGIDTIFYFPMQPWFVNEAFGRVSLSPTERQLIAKDHEIGSHTITHPLLTRIDPAQAHEEIYESRLELIEEFDQQIEAFSYPRGYANPELQAMVQFAGYSHARGVTVGYLDEPENPYYEQTTVHVGCDRKEYGGRNWLEYALDMMEMSTSLSTYHLWGHSWELAKDFHNFDKLKQLCEQLVKRK